MSGRPERAVFEGGGLREPICRGYQRVSLFLMVGAAFRLQYIVYCPEWEAMAHTPG